MASRRFCGRSAAHGSVSPLRDLLLQHDSIVSVHSRLVLNVSEIFTVGSIGSSNLIVLVLASWGVSLCFGGYMRPIAEELAIRFSLDPHPQEVTFMRSSACGTKVSENSTGMEQYPINLDTIGKASALASVDLQ